MKKILIIEDNVEILDNLAELLELSNYRVITAINGKQGVECALADHPDLILCDVMMPELDGYGVLHIVHNHPDLRKVPFIFLTAKAETIEIRKGMSLGADDYIPKPFDTTDLLNAIESRLKRSDVLNDPGDHDEPKAAVKTIDSVALRILQDFVLNRTIDKYHKKRTVYAEGNHPLRLYYLNHGKIRIYKVNQDGKELIIRMINDGDFFGYTALFERSRYKESAETMEDCEITGIPASEFYKLMDEHPSVAQRFLNILATDLSNTRQQMLHLAYDSLRKKVADALLALYHKYHATPGEFNIHVSRENLAAFAGTATESLIRTLSDFRSEKLIDMKEGSIAVLDTARLERIVMS